jgi:hypothetical protein
MLLTPFDLVQAPFNFTRATHARRLESAKIDAPRRDLPRLIA